MMDKLEQQLQAGLSGDFETGQRIADELELETPDDPRAAFNRGWYELQKGNLQKGHNLLDAGRAINAYGNRHIGTGKPIWHGEEGVTVLLNLEGGLGDQIHGYRFAEHIEARNCKVVISCGKELAPIFADRFITVAHEATDFVWFDYWLPSMSSVVALGLEYTDLSGTSYIDKTAKTIPGRIGVRWSGNPKFEHEQHRLFPKDLLFDAVRSSNCVSLQKDDDAPDWMPEVDLSTWLATRKQISKCELVITSCTSIAHLAAAMGIETWIIVPILPYYLWALPGNTSPYYDSVTLFRQEKYGDWSAPFEKIKENLQCMHMLKMAA